MELHLATLVPEQDAKILRATAFSGHRIVLRGIHVARAGWLSVLAVTVSMSTTGRTLARGCTLVSA